MKESIEIQNFGPIDYIKIDEIKPLTIFIGASGSGKSTIMKVLSLFQWIYKKSSIRSYLHYSGLKSPFRFHFDRLLKDNGLIDYLKSDTEIIYKNGTSTISYKNKGLKISPKYVAKDELSLEKIVFISDRRNMIADFSDNSNTKNNFYLSDTYENYQKASDVLGSFDIDFLDIRLNVKKTKLGTKHQISSINESRKYLIELKHASSGIQNAIPLNTIVEYYSKHYNLVDSINLSILSYISNTDSYKTFKPISNVGEFPNKRVTLFVEEPELSLFPESQLRLMDFLTNRCFVEAPTDYSMSLMLATHSPYIINYLNVLIRRSETNLAYINGNNLAVYRVYEGRLQNLIQYNEINGRISVNTADLAEPMSEVLREYRASL